MEPDYHNFTQEDKNSTLKTNLVLMFFTHLTPNCCLRFQSMKAFAARPFKLKNYYCLID